MNTTNLPPILIAGPTASGKSALALSIAEREDSVIVNADALQVYDCWNVLTARPSAQDLNKAKHLLYGHITAQEDYSVGHWLRELAPIIVETRQNSRRLIIVGGTGLYLTALTRGLAEIPAIPAEVRAEGDERRLEHGAFGFLDHLRRFDRQTYETIDKNNVARLQRAWEVLTATGTPISVWRQNTAAPLIAPDAAICLAIASPVEWLNPRIEKRFDHMLQNGALEECRAVLKHGWDPSLPASKALGAAALIDHIEGRTTLENAILDAKTATRQFAKRQRTWFRSNMADWTAADPNDTNDIINLITKR